jgi:glycosyltransferase involved in cell wall biosynthesis
MATLDRDVPDRKPLDGVTLIEMVSTIAPESFGLGYAALNLAAALDRVGVNVFLCSVDEEKDAYEACEDVGFPRERMIVGSSLGHPHLRLSPFLVRRLLKIPHDGSSIVHLHGLWTYVGHVARVVRRRLQCPLVLSPHGSLEPYALTMSPSRKALASLLYERRNIMTASCVWALSEQEKTSIRAHGFAGRVEVIPNGVSRAVECSAAEVADFRTRHGVARDARILLFLSRIAPKKNLPMLLKTFARSVKARPGWILLIAGSDEGGHINEVRDLIRELGIDQSVRLIGPVFGREKAYAFTSASLFVLPSHSEGLPIAVLEAMEYGKPVLVTEGWTLPVTTSARFGWRVSVDERAFETALLEATNSSEFTLAEMGQSARSIVREQFSWDSIAKQACVLYASLVDGDRKR